MKILLLNPPHPFKFSRTSRWPEHTKSGTLYYPFWLAYATGVLEETGHQSILIDAVANSWDFSQTISQVVKMAPELLVMETSTPSIVNDVKFAEELKRLCQIKVALVGPHVSVLPEQVLNMSKAIDFVARKEYDYTALDLANALGKKESLENIAGISYKKGDQIIHNPDRPFIEDLDSLPFVSEVYKKFLDIGKYRYALARHPMIQVWSSRGCPYRCTFCQLPQTFMGHSFRTRSPKNFVDELEWIKQNMPEVKEIFIEDDTFTVDKQRVVKICDLIEERNLNIVWSANVRADIPYQVLKRMKQTGCRMLIVGYESGSQALLNNVRKGITLQQAEEFTKNAQELGLKIFGCFMLGLPGETRETMQETFKFAQKLRPDMVFFQQAIPFPGTQFYDWCQQNNYLITSDFNSWLDPEGRLAFLVSYPQLNREEIERFRDKATINFYTSLKQLWYTFRRNLNWFEMVRLVKATIDYLTFLFNRRR